MNAIAKKIYLTLLLLNIPFLYLRVHHYLFPDYNIPVHFERERIYIMLVSGVALFLMLISILLYKLSWRVSKNVNKGSLNFVVPKILVLNLLGFSCSLSIFIFGNICLNVLVQYHFLSYILMAISLILAFVQFPRKSKIDSYFDEFISEPSLGRLKVPGTN